MCFGFALLRAATGLKKIPPLSPLINISSKTETNCTLFILFSRALHPLHVFASSSDWFTVSLASIVIGQRVPLKFKCYNTQLKTALSFTPLTLF